MWWFQCSKSNFTLISAVNNCVGTVHDFVHSTSTYRSGMIEFDYWWYTAMLTINRHFAFLWYKMRSLWKGKTYAKNTTSSLNLCYILKQGLDLSILKIWGLLVKGLQSYQLSKLEVTRKSLPTGPGPSQTSRPGFELYRGQIILKVWWLVILQPFDLQTQNF